MNQIFALAPFFPSTQWHSGQPTTATQLKEALAILKNNIEQKAASRPGDHEFIVSTPSLRFSIETREWEMMNVEKSFVKQGKLIMGRNPMITNGEGWIRFDGHIHINDQTISVDYFGNHSGRIEGSFRFERHTYINGFNHGHVQGMYRPKCQGQKIDVPLHVIDSIPHCEVEDLETEGFVVSFYEIVNNFIKELLYDNARLSGKFIDGMFTGNALLREEDGRIIFSGHVINCVVFNGVVEVDFDGDIERREYEDFILIQ